MNLGNFVMFIELKNLNEMKKVFNIGAHIVTEHDEGAVQLLYYSQSFVSLNVASGLGTRLSVKKIKR